MLDVNDIKTYGLGNYRTLITDNLGNQDYMLFFTIKVDSDEWTDWASGAFTDSNIIVNANGQSLEFTLRQYDGFIRIAVNLFKNTNLENLFVFSDAIGQMPAFHVIDMSCKHEISFKKLFVNSQVVSVENISCPNVTSFESMFEKCEMLTAVNTINGAGVETAKNMFKNCAELRVSPLFGADVFNGCTDFSGMFENCTKLTNVSYINTSAGLNFKKMFKNCSELKTLAQISFNEARNCSEMFMNCGSLEIMQEIVFDRQAEADADIQLTSMFENCHSLYELPILKLNNVNETIENCSMIFKNCSNAANNLVKNYYTLLIHLSSDTQIAHQDAFTNVGEYTNTAKYELEDIPKTWGGTEYDIPLNSFIFRIADPNVSIGTTNKNMLVNENSTTYRYSIAKVGVLHNDYAVTVYRRQNGDSTSVLETKNFYNAFPRIKDGIDFAFVKCNLPDAENLSGLFYHNTNITAIGNMILPNVTYMDSFCRSENSSYYPSKIKHVGNIIAPKCRTFAYAFERQYELIDVGMIIGDTENGIDALYLFRDCHKLETVDAAFIKQNKFTSCQCMFDDCGNLKHERNTIIDLSAATSANSSFKGNAHLFNVTIIGLETGVCKDLGYAFQNCKNLNQVNGLNLTHVQYAQHLFASTGITAIPEMEIGDVSQPPYKYSDWSSMFRNCDNLTEVDEFTAYALNICYLFSECKNLRKFNKLIVPASCKIDSDYRANGIFSYCTSLTEFPIIDAPAIECMKYTFESCKSVIHGKWTLNACTNLKNISQLYYYCENMEDMEDIVAPNITDASGLFGECKKLKNHPQLDLPNATDVSCMFSWCESLTTIGTSHDKPLKFKNVNNFNGMFEGCTSLTEIGPLDFSSATSTSMYQLFYDCENLTTIGIKLPKTLNDLREAFRNCEKLPETEINKILDSFTIQQYARLDGLFKGCKLLTTAPECITTTYTDGYGRLTNYYKGCSYLFAGTGLTNVPEHISAICSVSTNSSLHCSYTGMFAGCVNLKTIDSKWKISAPMVDRMFAGCTSLTSFNNEISYTPHSYVTIASMFAGCTNLTTVDTTFNFPNAYETNCYEIFKNCEKLIKIPKFNLHKSYVTTFRAAFLNCTSLSDWNDFYTYFDNEFTKLSDIAGMFQNCISFVDHIYDMYQSLLSTTRFDSFTDDYYIQGAFYATGYSTAEGRADAARIPEKPWRVINTSN